MIIYNGKELSQNLVEQRCHLYGTKLIETSEKLICPNHGIMIEEENIKENKKPNYIG